MSSMAAEGVDTLNLIVSPSKSFQKLLPINIPNSVEGYRQRVDSFTVFRWLGHLPSVSPLECARWGWQCVETDLLRCVSCRAFLYGRNDDLLTIKESDMKLKEALIRSHKSYCIWLTTSSPSSFHTLRFSSNGVCREGALAALRAFSHLPKCAIPTLDPASLSASAPFEVETTLLQSLEAERQSLRVSLEAWKPLLTLVLCGWSLATDRTTDSRMWRRLCIKISCVFCRRSLGLWQYNPMFPAEAAQVGGAARNKLVAFEEATIAREKSSKQQRHEREERKDEAEKIVAIVSCDSFVPPTSPTRDSTYKILHPKSPPPKSVPTRADSKLGERGGSHVAEDKYAPKLNRKSWKRSPEKSSEVPPLSPPPLPSPPGSAHAKPFTSPSSAASEIRTRSQSQSSPGSGSGGGGGLDQDGMTTRSGAIMRSPSGEPAMASAENKKRQRSGDSNHSGGGGEGGERGERSSKRIAAAYASDSGDRGRKRSGGVSASSSSTYSTTVAAADAKAVGLRVEEEKMGGGESDDDEASSSSTSVFLTFEKETTEPMEFGTAKLDPVAEHRMWCPYALDDYVFEADENLTAWEYVKRCLGASFAEEDEVTTATATKSSWLDDNLEKARKLMGF